MTVLAALGILEAAALECKKRNVNTLEVKEALDLLERYIYPKWLIPQFRHHVENEEQPLENEKANSKCYALPSQGFAAVFENFSGYEWMRWRVNSTRHTTWL